jgi:hypothetical protein
MNSGAIDRRLLYMHCSDRNAPGSSKTQQLFKKTLLHIPAIIPEQVPKKSENCILDKQHNSKYLTLVSKQILVDTNFYA